MTERVMLAWPRLLDVHLAAEYLSLGESTIRDYCADGLLRPVQLPGSLLRDKSGNVIARPEARRICKILIDRNDLDAFIDQRKGNDDVHE